MFYAPFFPLNIDCCMFCCIRVWLVFCEFYLSCSLFCTCIKWVMSSHGFIYFLIYINLCQSYRLLCWSWIKKLSLVGHIFHLFHWSCVNLSQGWWKIPSFIGGLLHTPFGTVQSCILAVGRIDHNTFYWLFPIITLFYLCIIKDSVHFS